MVGIHPVVMSAAWRIAATVALWLCAHTSAQAASLRHIWSAGFGDGSNQYVGCVALDPAAGVVAVGSFQGSIDFGGGSLMTESGYAMFVVRFASDGSHVWSRQFAQTNPAAPLPWVHAVAIDPDDNVVVAGELAGQLNLGGEDLFPSGMRSAFVAKFDASGSHVWSRQFGAAAAARDLATDANGNIAVAGDAIGAIDFGGGELVGQGGYDGFVATLGPDGSHVWSRRIGPSDHQYVRDIAMDRSGRVGVAGVFSSWVNAGGGLLPGAGGEDGYLAVYDATGAHQWSRRFGSTQRDECSGVSIDSLAGVVVVGSFRGTLDTGGGLLSAPALARNGFAIAFDAAGHHRWNLHLLAPESANVSAVDIDETGSVILAGEFHSAMFVGERVYPGPNNFLVVTDQDGEFRRAKMLLYGGWDMTVDVGVGGRLAFGASNYSTMNLGGDDIATAGYTDVLVAGLLLADVLPAPIVSFGAAVEASDVVVRWVVRDDLVSDFTLERWAGDERDRTVVASGPVGSHNGSYRDHDVLSREEYSYALTVSGGAEEYHSAPTTITVPPVATSLLQNAPNPFASSTEIEYRLDRPADVVIGIYDVTGARVRLLDEGPRGGGIHRAAWDGRDQAGRPVGSGVYFYRIENLTNAEPRKMMLVR